MNEICKKRLLKLADFLENTLPKKHFDLNYFTRDNDSYNQGDFTDEAVEIEYTTLLKKLRKITKDFQPHKCGAVACAIGWLPAIFPRSFIWDKEASVVLRKNKDAQYPSTDFDTVEVFLGIDQDQVHQLFTSDFYPKGRRGPKSVAKKIRNFVKTGRLSTKKYEISMARD